jgi:hypothetical protein
MKYRFIFLLGRAGCGKSALYRELEARLLETGQARSFERVDDFPKLWARLQDDNRRQEAGLERRYSIRTKDGGYGLTDPDLLDSILDEVNVDLLEIKRPDHMVFVEFARTYYVEAMQCFDRQILDDSLVIYMQVSFETCWQRNVARAKAAESEGGDDHGICRESMEKHYLHDDRDELVAHLQDRDIPVMVIDNEQEGEHHLKEQVETLMAALF